MTDTFTPGRKPEEYEIVGRPDLEIYAVTIRETSRMPIVTFYSPVDGVDAQFMGTPDTGEMKMVIRDKPREKTVWVNMYRDESNSLGVSCSGHLYSSYNEADRSIIGEYSYLGAYPVTVKL